MTVGKDADRKETAITTDPGVCEAVAEELVGKGNRSAVRIELMSSGCCDVSLGLRLDEARGDDLVEKIGGVTFVLSRQTYTRAGRVRISCRASGLFVITSERPVSEWDGFGACAIKS